VKRRVKPAQRSGSRSRAADMPRQLTEQSRFNAPGGGYGVGIISFYPARRATFPLLMPSSFATSVGCARGRRAEKAQRYQSFQDKWCPVPAQESNITTFHCVSRRSRRLGKQGPSLFVLVSFAIVHNHGISPPKVDRKVDGWGGN